MILFELAVIVGLVLLNAVFAGAEIAVISARKPRLQQLANEGSAAARAVLQLRAEPERFFATVQVGITVVGATAGAFGGATFAEHLEPFLAPLPFVGARAEPVSIAVVVVLVSYLTIVLGELVPKSLALKYAEPYAMLIARSLLGLAWLARPLVWLFTQSSNLLLRPFGDRTTFSESRVSADELREMLEDASKAGAVTEEIGEIATRALDFEKLEVSEVMVPRNRVHAIPVETSFERLRTILLEQGHTRMPVYRGSIDNIVGFVVIKDILAMIWERDLVVLEDLLRPAHFVPETLLARTLLRQFQEKRTQLAVVLDEHGTVAGIVTLEDLLEELVGELFSEDDKPEELIRADGDGAVVRGHAPIRDVNRELDLDLPVDGWNTVAGLAMHLAGGVPVRGTRLEVPGVAVLEVLDASPRSVRLVRITARPQPQD